MGDNLVPNGLSSGCKVSCSSLTPMRLVLLGDHDQPLDLVGQLVGVAHRPSRAIAQRNWPFLAIPVQQFVAGLAGNPECSGDMTEWRSFQNSVRQSGDVRP